MPQDLRSFQKDQILNCCSVISTKSDSHTHFCNEMRNQGITLYEDLYGSNSECYYTGNCTPFWRFDYQTGLNILKMDYVMNVKFVFYIFELVKC